MGWGDEIIASGQARKLQQDSGSSSKVYIRDRHGSIRQHAMWENNPRIANRSDRLHKALEMTNGPGLRPYIAAKSESQWRWNEWECPVGEIYFHKHEIEFAAKHHVDILIEPNVKAKASPNKDWGGGRWKILTHLMGAHGLKAYQVGPPGTHVLPEVEFIETPSFRHGCAVLARARAAVLPEGGLHHAAASLDIKSIVIFGGFISPKQTGYASQTNLFTGGEACGMRLPCRHCAAAMEAITPQLVMTKLLELLS